MDWPLKSVCKVWHIGTMRVENKAGDSYEGAGISVSTHPHEWARIARIGLVPLWETRNPEALFLDNAKLSDAHRDSMREWAIEGGLAVPSSGRHGYSCTQGMAQRMQVRNPGDTYVRGLVAAAYAEDVLGIDGVWWAGRVSTWHAPRGVIVPSRIPAWTWELKVPGDGMQVSATGMTP
jgi:hypothetical protein